MTGTTLKQYAIDRLLANADSELLRYVNAGDVVPIAVLETEIEPLLAGFDNARAKAFEQDYESFVTEDAKLEPVVLVPIGDPSERRFKAGGSIDKGLATAIEQVHGVSAPDLAHRIIERTMHTINPDHVVHVENLSITEQLEAITERFEAITPLTPIAFDDTEADYETITPDELMEDKPLHIDNDEVFVSGFQKPEPTATPDFDDFAEVPESLDIADEDVFAPQAPAQSVAKVEVTPTQPVFQNVTFVEPDGNIHAVSAEPTDFAPRFETQEPVVIEPETRDTALRGLVDIYRDLAAYVREFNLDEKLDIQLKSPKMALAY